MHTRLATGDFSKHMQKLNHTKNIGELSCLTSLITQTLGVENDTVEQLPPNDDTSRRCKMCVITSHGKCALLHLMQNVRYYISCKMCVITSHGKCALLHLMENVRYYISWKMCVITSHGKCALLHLMENVRYYISWKMCVITSHGKCALLHLMEKGINQLMIQRAKCAKCHQSVCQKHKITTCESCTLNTRYTILTLLVTCFVSK